MTRSKEPNTTEPTGLYSAQSLTHAEVGNLIQPEFGDDPIVAETQW